MPERVVVPVPLLMTARPVVVTLPLTTKLPAPVTVNVAPAVDVIEDEKQYVIVAELPGLTKQDIEVKVDGDTLHVSGERKAPEVVEGRAYLRSERVYGRFTRSFRLPEDADPAGVAAEFRDGLLELRLAKREEAQPKVIDVKVG